MSFPAECRNDKAVIVSLLRQAETGEPLQARTIFQAGGSAWHSAQDQPVQSGAATGLQIGLAPHAGFLPAQSARWQAVPHGFCVVAFAGISLDWHDTDADIRLVAVAAANRP